MNTRNLLSFSAVSFAGLSSAVATSDYGPAVSRIITGCAKYYTSGYGHNFCVVHDMEGYYLGSISYLSRCDVSSSVHYCANGVQDTSSDAPAGEISQLVAEAYYAWHATCWNRYSLGCEHEGFASNPAWFTEALYQASASLYRHWCDKFGIPKDRNHIVAHGQKSVAGWPAWASANLGIDPYCNTHTDPGPYWDWNHYMDLINNGSCPSAPYDEQHGIEVVDDNGRLHLFAVGPDTVVYHNWQMVPHSGPWSGWNSLGNWLVGGIAVGKNADGRLEVFSTSLDNHVRHTWQNIDGSWTDWADLGGDFNRIAVMSNNDGRLELFAIGTDTIMYHNWQTAPNGLWSGWGSLGGAFLKNFVPGKDADGRLTVFARGGDDGAYMTWQTAVNGGWSGFNSLNNGQCIGSLARGINSDGREEVFACLGSGDVWHDWQGAPNGGWDGWWVLQGGPANFVTTANEANGAISVFVRGGYALPFVMTQGVNWGGTWTLIGNQPVKNVITVGRNSDGRLELFFFNYNSGEVDEAWETAANGSWSGVSGMGVPAAGSTVNYALAGTLTAPSSVNAGQTFTASISMTNTGSRAWGSSGANAHKLGSQSPQDNSTWGATRVLLPASTVNPDRSVTFTATFTAPVTPGTYAFAWKMVQEGIEWFGQTASKNIQVVAAAPVISTQPQSQTVTSGYNASFSVTAGGATPLAYQWRKGTANLSGATASSLTLTAVQSADQGSYSVVVTNSVGTVISTTATLTVLNTPPSITTQPAGGTVVAGSNVGLSVTATGAIPLSYQWRRNGVNISGATLSSLARNNVQPGDAGTYSVVVTNLFGSITSSDAVLTVMTLPQITTQPQGQTVAALASATFTVTATGAAPLSYQWRRNGVNIAGGTASSYTRNNVGSADVGLYSVVVSNPYGSVTSAEAALSLSAVVVFNENFESGNLNDWTVAASPATALTISTAQNHTTGGGGVAVYSAQADSSLDKMYHNLGLELQGHARLIFYAYDDTANTLNTGQNRWFGEMRAYDGTGYGDGTLLQLFAIGRYGINLGAGTGTLAGQTVNTTNYQARVLDGDNTGWFNLSIQRSVGWHKFEIDRAADGRTINFYVDGVLGGSVPAATFAAWDSTTLGSVAAGTTGGSAWFDDVTVQYYDPPSVTGQPVGHTVTAGGSATFSVSATNNVQSYQWRLNGVAISGATTSTLTVNNAQDANAGSYTVVVGNGAGDVVSASASLGVAPLITSSPVSVTTNAGATVTFAVASTGQTPLAYQWKKNNANLSNGDNVSGADSPVLTLTGVDQSDAATYTVLVSNTAGSATSTPATLVVINPPVISTHPQSQAVAAGANVVFSAVASGGAPLSFQWRLNGTDIPGASSSAYTRPNVHSADAGSYDVLVTNPGGTLASAAAVLTVNNPPSLAAIGNRTIHAGGTVAIATSATDPDLTQALAFTLDPGAPADASVNSTNGVFTWTSSDASANTTNAVTVRVTDSGTPSLSDAKSFTIAVLARPTILSATVTSDLITLTWNSIPGQTYRVQFKLNLEDAEWTDLTDVGATGSTASVVDARASDGGLIPQRFYRVIVAD